jgi:hypothetical protein
VQNRTRLPRASSSEPWMARLWCRDGAAGRGEGPAGVKDTRRKPWSSSRGGGEGSADYADPSDRRDERMSP